MTLFIRDDAISISVFPFSVFPFSVFPFSGDKYFHSQVTSTKSCERGSSPAPPSPGEEEAITITNSHTRCFSAFKLFYHLFGQIFVKICVKLIITHPTNLHTRWLSQRCVFGFYIFSHLFCCQKSCQAYNHLLGRRRQAISQTHTQCLFLLSYFFFFFKIFVKNIVKLIITIQKYHELTHKIVFTLCVPFNFFCKLSVCFFIIVVVAAKFTSPLKVQLHLLQADHHHHCGNILVSSSSSPSSSPSSSRSSSLSSRWSFHFQ